MLLLPSLQSDHLKKQAYQGSNSWMMLSNRITAKSLELKPARQARKRMLKESKDCHPAGCVSPPDRPPLLLLLLPPPPPAAAAPGLLFPCTELPALADALCLPSLAAWCSAISACCVRSDLLGCPCTATLPCLPPVRTVVKLSPSSESVSQSVSFFYPPPLPLYPVHTSPPPPPPPPLVNI